MAVTSTTRSISYTGNASTTTFSVPFKFIDSSHLVVTVTPSGGVASVYTEGVGYTVTGEGEEAGGNVIFSSAPAASAAIVIERTVPLTQPTAFRSQGTFSAYTHETEFDRRAMVEQQLDARLDDLEAEFDAADGGTLDSIALTALQALTVEHESRLDTIQATVLYADDYGVVGDGSTNDTTAMQAFLTALSAGSSGDRLKGIVSPGTYRVNAALTMSSSFETYGELIFEPGAVIDWDGNDAATSVLTLAGMYKWRVKGLVITNGASNLALAGIRLATDGVHPMRGCTLEGCYVNPGAASSFTYGFYIDSTAFNGNNDFHTLRRCGCLTGGIINADLRINGNQAVDHLLENCDFLGQGMYGVRSNASFHWKGGASGAHTVADFFQEDMNSVAGSIIIDGCNSEGSARFFTTYEPASSGTGVLPTTRNENLLSVSFKNVRFSCDGMALDGIEAVGGGTRTLGRSGFAANQLDGSTGTVGFGYAVYYRWRGPVSMVNCLWGQAGELVTRNAINGVRRVRLSLGGTYGCSASVLGCSFAGDNYAASPIDEVHDNTLGDQNILFAGNLMYVALVTAGAPAVVSASVTMAMKDIYPTPKGTLTITGAATTGAVTFYAPEGNANFIIPMPLVTAVTGAPAAGSYVPLSVARTTTGFTLTLTAAPGVGNSVTYGWVMFRTN